MEENFIPFDQFVPFFKEKFSNCNIVFADFLNETLFFGLEFPKNFVFMSNTYMKFSSVDFSRSRIYGWIEQKYFYHFMEDFSIVSKP